MAERPELIVVGQYKIGGVQSFYHNILSNDPAGAFDIRWIFVDQEDRFGSKPVEAYGHPGEVVFKAPLFDNEDFPGIASRLEQLISDRPGALVTNFEIELSTLYLHPKKNKTVYYVCHDDLYLERAERFAFLIDVFIAHNPYYFERLIKQLPSRKESIFYMPYGVKIPSFTRAENPNSVLKVVIATRLIEGKGIFDLPIIDNILKQSGVTVEWTIIGDGPEKARLKDAIAPLDNFVLKTLPSNQLVVEEFAKNDVFILPSRLDGLPVALLESMSVGCVPVLSNFNEGIKKVVTEDIGFIHWEGNNQAFARSIAFLNSNRNELEGRSLAARRKIDTDYEVTRRAREYFDLFARHAELKMPPEKRHALYGTDPINPLNARPNWTTAAKDTFLRLFPSLRPVLKRAKRILVTR